jgi:urease accessory protein
MGHPETNSAQSIPLMQRAVGEVDLVMASGHLRRCFQSGSAKLFLPKTYSPSSEAVLINTAGGLAEGDAFTFRLHASEQTDLTVTTQAAERVYGAIGSRAAHLNIDITITNGASLHWLPQETILFDSGRLARSLTVQMDQSSSFLASEITVFGRKAMDETIRNGFLNDQWRIYRQGKLMHAEAIWLDGPIAEKLADSAAAADMSCLATILWVAEGVEQHAKSTRAYFDTTPAVHAAVSCWDGKLVIRCLADETKEIKAALSGCLRLLRGFDVPRVWNV